MKSDDCVLTRTPDLDTAAAQQQGKPSTRKSTKTGKSLKKDKKLRSHHDGSQRQ